MSGVTNSIASTTAIGQHGKGERSLRAQEERGGGEGGGQHHPGGCDLWAVRKEVLDAIDVSSHEALNAAAGPRACTEVVLQVPVCNTQDTVTSKRLHP